MVPDSQDNKHSVERSCGTTSEFGSYKTRKHQEKNKLGGVGAQCQVFLPKITLLESQLKITLKQKSKFSVSAQFFLIYVLCCKYFLHNYLCKSIFLQLINPPPPPPPPPPRPPNILQTFITLTFFKVKAFPNF